jgi:hypothetical protein
VTAVAKELKCIDISNIPELLRIAQEVRRTNEPHILRQGSEDLAILTPIKPVVKKGAKGKPTTKDDPLWKLVGSATEAQPTDASKIHEYLAEGYSTHHQV